MPNSRPESETMEQQSDKTNGQAASATSLTSRAYQRIRDEIISGALEPGRKLKIEDLRQVYGTGASPIREALSLLTSDRLVERIDQRGFRVAHVGAEAYEELLKTRCWLEERALRESIRNGGKDWEERVVLAQYHLSRTDRSLDSKKFVANSDWEQHHKRFHLALLSACGSSIMLQFCEQLYDQNIRYRNIAGSSAYPKRDISQEHDEIARAALDRQEDAAARHLISHYRATGVFLSERIG